MKRLLQKIYHNSRLLRKKLARWQPVNMKTGNPLQILTDAMAYNATVQINYKNSGWRTILPYGWNSSKDGNILLMCYKNTGEIRSYRIDRIHDLLIDDELLNRMPGDRPDEPAASFNDFQIPTLPNIDEIIDETEAEDAEELPYDAGLKALTNNEIVEDYQPVDTVNDSDDDQLSDDDINNDEDEDENEIENDNDLDDFNFDDDLLFDDDDENKNEENNNGDDSDNENNENEEDLLFDLDNENSDEEEK